MKTLKLPLTCIYMVIFSLYSLMTRFTYTAALIDGSINTLLYRVILVFGCLLALWWLVTCRSLFSFKTNKVPTDLIILGVFVLVLCISTVLNYSYNLADNLYGVLTFGFQLVLFYLMGRTLSAEEWSNVLKKIILACSFLWDIACISSLVQFFLNISYTTRYASDHGVVRQGITDGRLFGLFSDPNFAAFTSLLLIFGLWHILFHIRYTATRIFVWLSLGLNAMYLVMSNSRTVYLSVIAGILFYALLSCYKKNQAQGISGFAMIRRMLVRTLVTLLLLVAGYFVILTPLRGIAKLICPERDIEVEMERDDINDENISNNRFTIWQSYLELYKEKPLFGFSTRSALPYVSKKHPDSYLATTQYVTHNAYLSLLVETGAVGFLTMAVFMVLLLIRFIRKVHSREQLSGTCRLFATWLVTILIFCICFHDIFFTLNLETMLFFCGLGFLWKSC